MMIALSLVLFVSACIACWLGHFGPAVVLAVLWWFVREHA